MVVGSEDAHDHIYLIFSPDKVCLHRILRSASVRQSDGFPHFAHGLDRYGFSPSLAIVQDVPNFVRILIQFDASLAETSQVLI